MAARIAPANSPPRQSAPSSSQSLYNDPALYDEAFSYRDFAAEAKFLLAAYKHHCTGSKLNSVLELG